MNVLNALRRLVMDTFGFSRTETNGLLVLLLVVVLAGILPRLYFLNQKQSLSTSNNQDLEQWIAEIEDTRFKEFETVAHSSTVHKNPPKPFDPNTADIATMMNAGLPEFMANRIINYRSKGGHFREFEDMTKLYGMTPDILAQIEPYVDIKEKVTANSFKSEKPEFSKPEIQTFELNTATVEQLKQISGIGDVLSDRIIRYRNSLGGFHNTAQLYEIYGLTPEVIEKLLPHATLNPELAYFNFNADSIKHLSAHPYINWNLAKIMFNYRKVHGDFKKPEDLKNIKVLSDSLYQKLYPYLSR